MYLPSLDIKDAFYAVPIHRLRRKFPKSMWLAVSYQLNSMPNGYKDAMRVFTKLLKPSFYYLREQGYALICSLY